MIKKFYLCTLLSALLFLSERYNALGQTRKFGFEIRDKNRKAVIPFDIHSNLIVVNVLFQGVIPLKFIVDTGVTNTVLIDKVYSDILDIVPDRKISLIGAAGGKEVEAYIVNSISINVFEIVGNNIPLLVLKEDYLKLQETLGVKIHGILGYDLFKNFIVKIDYASKVLSFYDPIQFNRSLKWYSQLNMEVENTKPYITIPVVLKDSFQLSAKLLIDTGASHSMMLHQNSNQNIHVPKKNIRDILGAGIAGTIEGHVGRVDNLSIGKYMLDDVICNFPDSGTYNDVIKSTGRVGTLGGGILKRFKLFFDYQNEKLYYKRSKNFKEPFEYDKSGLTIVAKGEIFLEPYYEIEEVRKGTPAYEAGIRAKDILLSLNNTKSKNLDLDMINNTLSKKAGKKIKIKVKRNDEVIETEFYLEEFI
ncbi:hypothetical protein GCM10011506_32260 [Marivirga lumbricoides]|uniref:PDZ domain-containing protein n=1 Tax=Marivirga lumbricoides TaxID=1046115 RepID=A0ABQ1MP93_9BACT|nr:hypothetical protein GCM10011506_32260 [Marivirga lumbricoides]